MRWLTTQLVTLLAFAGLFAGVGAFVGAVLGWLWTPLGEPLAVLSLTLFGLDSGRLGLITLCALCGAAAGVLMALFTRSNG